MKRKSDILIIRKVGTSVHTNENEINVLYDPGSVHAVVGKSIWRKIGDIIQNSKLGSLW